MSEIKALLLEITPLCSDIIDLIDEMAKPDVFKAGGEYNIIYSFPEVNVEYVVGMVATVISRTDTYVDIIYKYHDFYGNHTGYFQNNMDYIRKTIHIGANRDEYIKFLPSSTSRLSTIMRSSDLIMKKII